jgi:hypothetical protein
MNRGEVFLNTVYVFAALIAFGVFCHYCTFCAVGKVP